MKTLEIRNGDLALGSDGYATVTGSKKVFQDLGILVREPLGADRFHTRWGSILEDYIGQWSNDESKLRVQSEIQRLIQNYIVMQTRQIEADAATNRRPRYSPDEIVVGVESIDIQQLYDRLNVRVVVRTESGESVTVLRTVGFE